MSRRGQVVAEPEEVDEVEEEDIADDEDGSDEDDEIVDSADKRKKLSQQKKDELAERKKSRENVVRMTKAVFSMTNRLVPQKTDKKVEILEGGEKFDKAYVTRAQRLLISTLEHTLRNLSSKTTSSTRKVKDGNNQYQNPIYFKPQVVAWLKDLKFSLSQYKELRDTQYPLNKKDTESTKTDILRVNDLSSGETVAYGGEEFSKVLLMVNEGFDLKFGDVEIALDGIGTKQILNDLLNLYMNVKNLKGVEVTVPNKLDKEGKPTVGKDGKTTTTKLDCSVWRPDALIMKHFGVEIETIANKEKNEANRNGIKLDKSCVQMHNLMSLISLLTDTQRNTENKENLKNPELVSLLRVDTRLVNIVSGIIKERLEKK